MVWVIVILAAILVLGPVLYLLPTRRDRLQAALRSAARAAGLVVELATIYKIESEAHERVSAGGEARVPRLSCVRYGLPMENPQTGLEPLYLVRGATLDWQHDPEHPAVADDALYAVVRPLLDALPPTTRGVAVTPSLVWVYWLESLAEADSAVQTVDAIARALRTLRNAVAQWHTGRLP